MAEYIHHGKKQGNHNHPSTVQRRRSQAGAGFMLQDNRYETSKRPTLQLQTAGSPGAGVVQRNPLKWLTKAFTRPAAKKILPQSSVLYRATTQSPHDLENAGGMNRLGNADSDIPAYRIPLYMVSSYTNPGVISTARSADAAIRFAQEARNNYEGGRPPTYYVYKIDASGQEAIDLEKTIPSIFSWLYSGEEEEMITRDIPHDKVELLRQVGEKEEEVD